MLQSKGEVCWLASASQPSVFIRDDVYCNCIGTRRRDGPRDCVMICWSIKGEPPRFQNVACILMTQNISPRDAWPPKIENTRGFVGLRSWMPHCRRNRERGRRGHRRHNIVLSLHVRFGAASRSTADYARTIHIPAHIAETLRKIVKTNRQLNSESTENRRQQIADFKCRSKTCGMY